MYGDSTHAGPQRLMRQRKVVLVTCNYRLGVLGYLSTGDSELPGNFGGIKCYLLKVTFPLQT